MILCYDVKLREQNFGVLTNMYVPVYAWHVDDDVDHVAA